MPRRKRITKINDGITRLEGYDVGKYPLHHFVFLMGDEQQAAWPLRVLSTGRDEWVKGCLRRRSNSQICALEFVTDGSFRFTQNGQVHTVEPGQLFIVRPGADNEMAVLEGIGRKRVMELSGPLLPVLLGITGLDKCDVVQPTNLTWLEARYDEAYELADTQPADFMRRGSALVYEVLIELGRAATQSKYPRELQEILDHMEQQTGRSLTVVELCKIFGVSQASLHRLFRNHLDQSPIGYFIGIKMQTARTMLTASHYSIKEIAQQLGYSNQLYFSSEFKKRVGVSPRAYRANPHVVDRLD